MKTPKEQVLEICANLQKQNLSTSDMLAAAAILSGAGLGIAVSLAKDGKLSDVLLLSLMEDLSQVQADLKAAYLGTKPK